MATETRHGKQWNELDGTAAEMEMGEVLFGLVRMLKPELVVETGTYVGSTARWLGFACRDNLFGRVVSCEINERMHIQTVVNYRATEPIPVELRLCSSLDLPELRAADFVFSDSAQELRAQEYELVKPGCVFVVHDTAVSYSTNTDQAWLGKWVLSQGGLTFDAGRGFGILVKPR